MERGVRVAARSDRLHVEGPQSARQYDASVKITPDTGLVDRGLSQHVCKSCCCLQGIYHVNVGRLFATFP